MTQDQPLVRHSHNDAIHINPLMRKTTEATHLDSIDQHHDEP